MAAPLNYARLATAAEDAAINAAASRFIGDVAAACSHIYGQAKLDGLEPGPRATLLMNMALNGMVNGIEEAPLGARFMGIGCGVGTILAQFDPRGRTALLGALNRGVSASLAQSEGLFQPRGNA